MASRIWIGILCAGSLALAACSQAPSQGPSSALASQVRGGRVVAVSVAPVSKGAIQSILSYSGSIQAKGQVNLVPKTSGRIEKLLVDVGDAVKTGDVIAQMEKSSAKVQVQQAEASLASAKARLATIKAGARPEDIAGSEAAVRNAQARLDQLNPTDSDLASAQASLAAARAQLTKADNDLAKLKAGPDPDAVRLAQLDVERSKATLWSAQSSRDGQCSRRGADYLCDAANASTMAAEIGVTQAQARLDTLLAGPKSEDIANAQKNAESARAAVASAQSRLDQLAAGPKAPDLAAAQATLDQAQSQLEAKRRPYTAEDVKVSEATVDQAQASLDSARLALSDTTLVAPFDGIIASRLLSEGALASTQTPLFSLISRDVELQVSVEEARISLFRQDLPVALTVPAYQGATFSGKVTGVAPVADAKSHTFLIKIAPDNSSGKLSPGMFADVRVTADKREGALLVPKEAVLQQGDKRILFVAKDGQASLRTIQAGFSDDKVVEVLQGVEADEQVIVAGHMGLNNGDRLLLPGQGDGQRRAPEGQTAGSGGPSGGAPGGPGGYSGGAPGAKPGGQSGSGKPGGATATPAAKQ